ncbi:hypothetical protein B0T10DRAFT_533321 [Thelonectria olida]|uniref:BTB domain-containing protein n=1 Tax=Thelonectria olida TaxID=1576542 RepID=A0A9P8VU25_9HYPO|nr:hypothetical protein B0T10DRAFT_533321 [Thelonectria olida]
MNKRARRSPRCRRALAEEAPAEESVAEEPAENPLEESTGNETEEGSVMRMRVSSRHLILASPVFRNMLDGPFKEGTACEPGRRQISTSNWDANALMILLNIIHGHLREVPRSLSLEMPAKFAIIVDYYKCHEVVEVFVDIWLKAMENNLPTFHGKELMLWLLVSWVFSQDETRIKHSKNTIMAMDLPIPGDVLGKIDDKRQEALAQVFESLYGLFDTVCDESVYSFEYSSMLLGPLTKELRRYRTLNPRATKPFAGHSTVKGMVNGFQTPPWSPLRRSRHKSYYYEECAKHSCSIIAQMKPILEKIEEGLHGLKLENYHRLVDRK